MRKVIMTPRCTEDRPSHALLAKLGPHEESVLTMDLSELLTMIRTCEVYDEMLRHYELDRILLSAIRPAPGLGSCLIKVIKDMDYLCVTHEELSCPESLTLVDHILEPWLKKLTADHISRLTWWRERGGFWV